MASKCYTMPEAIEFLEVCERTEGMAKWKINGEIEVNGREMIKGVVADRTEVLFTVRTLKLSIKKERASQKVEWTTGQKRNEEEISSNKI